MQVIHMKFRPKQHVQRSIKPLESSNSPARMQATNVFSYPPCSSSETAIAYSKGKIPAMSKVDWDEE